MPTDVIPFGAEAAAAAGLTPNTGAEGVAGVSGGATVATSASQTEAGNSFVYTVIVQVPIPFFNLDLDLDLVGDFILPALSAVGVPKAVASFLANATGLFNNIIADCQVLIRAIPEATVRLVVKVGPTVILNVLLIAEKVPVVITPPTFQLALPNIAADANLSFTLPFPPGPSIVIRIPIPVPVVQPVPLLSVTGGQVSASATGDTVVTPEGSSGAVAETGGAAISDFGFAGGTGIAVPEIVNPIVTTDI